MIVTASKNVFRKGMIIIMTAPYDKDGEKDNEYKYYLTRESTEPIWIAQIVKYYGHQRDYADVHFYRAGSFNVIEDDDLHMHLEDDIYRVRNISTSCKGTLRYLKHPKEIRDKLQRIKDEDEKKEIEKANKKRKRDDALSGNILK